MSKIKVLVADSSQIYALGLFYSLAEDQRIEVFNHTYESHQVLDTVRKIKPDIVLIGSELLYHSEARVCEDIQEQYPEVKIIALISSEKMESLLSEAINSGAKGILPRNISPTELVNSIIDTATLGATIHPTVMPQIMKGLQERLNEEPVVEVILSNREIEVLDLVAEGKSNRDIAEKLFISENTVKGHIKRICSKLNIQNRVEMTRYVLLDKSNNITFRV